jgi:hypothetical protein
MNRLLFPLSILFSLSILLLLHIHTCEASTSSSSLSYSLPNHRSITEQAYDAVKEHFAGSGGSRVDQPKQDLFSDQSSSSSSSSSSSGTFSKLHTLVSRKISSFSARTIVSAGNAIDRLFGRRAEARSIIAKSHNLKEFVDRINLRLGVTYPDLPLDGNKPLEYSDSLQTLALRLFSLRHLKSGSVTGLRQTATTHEGDRQYWHSMASGLNSAESNSDVEVAIEIYLNGLYQSSRTASPAHRWWYYGRILHTIQDSYSDAHCARNVDSPRLPIHFFQNYAEQSMRKHSSSDTSPEEDAAKLADMSDSTESDEREALQRILGRKKKLAARALKMSIAFLKLVWDNVPTDGETRAPSKWWHVRTLLSDVFHFENAQWLEAAAGGSLPAYASDAAHARALSDVGERKAKDGAFRGAYGVYVAISKIVATGLHDEDIIGSSDPFIVITTENREKDDKDNTGGNTNTLPHRSKQVSFQTQTAPPSKMRKSKSTFEWELSHEFRGAPERQLTFTVYDSDTLIGIPRASNSELLGSGVASFGGFMMDNDNVHNYVDVTVTVKLSRDGQPAGELRVTGRASGVLFDNNQYVAGTRSA